MNRTRHSRLLRSLVAVSLALGFTTLVMASLAMAVQPAMASDSVGAANAVPVLGQTITEPVRVPPGQWPQVPTRTPRETLSVQQLPANSILGLSLSAPTVINNGDYIVYDITVINHGTTELQNVLIVDVMPQDQGKYILSDVECSANCGRDFDSALIREPSGGTVLVTITRQVSWTIDLAPGTPQTLSFWGRVIGQADGTTFSNIAYGQQESTGPATSNIVQTTIRVPGGEDGTASVSSAPTWLSADLGGTLSMDWGDFDHDGDMDLALGSTGGTTVYRNEQGRLEVFWENNLYTLGVRWADMNRDGQLELVAVGESISNTASTTGTNYIYYRTNGSFAVADTFISAYQLVRVEPGDFDNDGWIDLIVSTNSINAECPVRLYWNNKDGTFSDYDSTILYYGWPYDTNPCISYRRATASISPVDYDKDGYLDLVVGEFPSRIWLWRHRASPRPDPLSQPWWTPFSQRTAVPGLSFLPYDFSWGDYDGDGDLDLAAAFPLDRRARIYRNDTGGKLTPVKDFRTALFRTPLDVEWGDFDGDGLLDLAVADAPPRIYINNDGTFLSTSRLETGAVKGEIWSMATADHDNDGDADLSLGNRDGSSSLFTTFAPFLDTAMTHTVSYNASSVAWGDINGDGYNELLFGTDKGTLENARLYGNAGGRFPTQTIFVFGGFGPRYVAFADIDRDYDLDIAASTIRSIRIYENNAGSFGLAYDLDTSQYDISALAWADVDTDHDLDLLVGRKGPNALYLAEYDSVSHSWELGSTPDWVFAETDNTTSVAWGDYDDDLYPDIAVGNTGAPNRIYHNNGDNTFTLAWSAAGSYNTTSVAWADYDGDGDLDLAVGNDGQVNMIYRNNDGTFSTASAWQSPVTRNTTSLAWGDWDSDGDLDLAVGNRGQPDQVYDNENGSLNWSWTSAASYNTTAVAWGDQDKDGDLDLAVSQSGAGTIGVYENSYAYPSHLHNGNGPDPNNASYVYVGRPGSTRDGYLFSSGEVLGQPAYPTVTVDYILYDAEGDTISNTIYEYSLDGGGTWRVATAATAPTIATAATSTGTPKSFLWDAQTDAAIGDNVRFRITIDYQDPLALNKTARGSAISPPFRTQGTRCIWPEDPQIQYSPSNPGTEDAVHFVGIIRGGTGSEQVFFTWDFDDGTATVSGQAVDHVFGRNGVFNVKLTVTSSPCPIAHSLSTIRSITIGTGIPNIYVPMVLKSWNASSSSGGQ